MIDEQTIQTYAALVIMKALDVGPDEGGMELSLDLPHQFAGLEGLLQDLVVQGMLEVHRRKGQYVLSQAGIDYLGTMIDEAEAYIDEFDEKETEEMLQELQRRRIDPLRVRFLWGWYQQEFDDIVVYQQRRGMVPVNHDWSEFLLGQEFYADLARDLE